MQLMNEDPMWLRWQEQAPLIYDEIYYNTNPVVSFVNRFGHTWLERGYGPDLHFNDVLEVGAGTGEHLGYVRHSYNRYHLTDLNPRLLAEARKRNSGNSRVIFEQRDALKLDYPDASFDRLISVYNLEHLPNPHLVLKEWRRVLRPGATLSLAIPTEGGWAWNLGRYLTTRRYFRRKGLDLDYIIAREHINACYRLVSLIRHYFPKREESWFPMRAPLPDVNLIYACNIVLD
jgi:phosphatidylethanolamine/phosphatidyl-N-methylethanolamine N-methyltransferase